MATKHDARIFATELHGTLNIPKPGDHTPNTAIVTYKTLDERTLFVDFMGILIGLANEKSEAPLSSSSIQNMDLYASSTRSLLKSRIVCNPSITPIIVDTTMRLHYHQTSMFH